MFAISLIALAAGFVALARDRQISNASRSDKVVVSGTVLSCLTMRTSPESAPLFADEQEES